jgi:PST family polysaccharide transporter
LEGIAKKAGRGIAWSAAGSMGSQITSFVVFIVLTRLLEPKDFGLLGMAAVFTAIVGLFAEQGFEQAIVQKKDLEQDHLDTAFWASLLIGGILTVFGIFMSGWVASLYGEPQLKSVISLLSTSFVFAALKSTQQGYLIREFAFRSLSLRLLIAGIVSGGLGILAAFLGAGVYALVIKFLVNGFVDVVLLWKTSAWRPRLHYSSRHFRELFQFGVNMIGVKVTNFMRRYSDNLLIGFFLGAAALGYYTVAYRLARLLMDLLDSVIGQVSVSAFARLQDDKSRLGRVINKIIKLANLIFFPLFTGLILLAPDLLFLFSGSKWLPAVPVMRVLSFSGFAIITQIVLSYLMIGMGRTSLLLRVNFINAATYVSAFAFTAKLGIYYVGLAYAAVSFVYLGIYLYLGRRITGLDCREYFFHFCLSAISCGIMAVAILFFADLLKEEMSAGGPVKVATMTFLGMVIYSFCVYLLQRNVLLEAYGLASAMFNLEQYLQKNEA